ncbi:DUF3108 domain-containing protein [Massilia sp. TS11]|uniref:DUF3108 domain-containing protein n=1 Tax=Massilia sp. TS11 TaxID=2908003 RepID=UPI001ED9E7E6|nr:DUF3108 domain-containing protein [Massilia sp. TS11]MCG2582951.1 DUF3108 domain-containing protein [Massilia sp. TS11]
MPLLRAILLLALSASASAAPVALQVGQPLARFDLLKNGTHHYLRYMKNGAANQMIDIWQREVRIEGDSLRIVQRWDGNGTLRTLDSQFERGSFRPYSHERISEKDGKRNEERFRFGPEGVTDAAGKTVSGAEAPYNFETDIEFLQTLPLAKDYEVSIPFYHPGGQPPARYVFKVQGEQTIAGPQGPVACWVVTTDYNRPNYTSTFWIAKATQLLVRQESPTADGKLLIKALID